MHHPSGSEIADSRISLNLPPQMKAEQLATMRNHLEAVQEIIELISKGEFKKASDTAHSRLGLTEEMKQMCSTFENETFKTLGFGFHESADRLGEELKTGDTTRALQAMNRMMGYCVSCHKVFKQ